MKKLLFIITTITVLILLFIAYLFLTSLGKKDSTTQEPPFPTASQVRPPTPTPTAPPLVEDEPLTEQIINRLPVVTDEYSIEYFSEQNLFSVTIKLPPLEENKQRANQWFLDNGFSSTEGLNILYSSYPWVQ